QYVFSSEQGFAHDCMMRVGGSCDDDSFNHRILEDTAIVLLGTDLGEHFGYPLQSMRILISDGRHFTAGKSTEVTQMIRTPMTATDHRNAYWGRSRRRLYRLLN